MGRSAAEIDAAKAVLTTTDLGAITSEVRQFPPGYVTGGRLKLNTNLQIEVAPIAINIAGKDVRIPDTVIIGNEHWIIDGVETPRVPGSWYYLYLSSAGQFAVSPNEPVYNALYFAYYHPEIQDLRAIGKLYFGDDGTVLYVQTSLETASAQVLIATSTYKGEDANYYCNGTNDHIFFDSAINYLSENFSYSKIYFTEGTIHINLAFPSSDFDITKNISLIGNHTKITLDNPSWGTQILFHEVQDVTIEALGFDNIQLSVQPNAKNVKVKNNVFQNEYACLVYDGDKGFVDENKFENTRDLALLVYGSQNIVCNNFGNDCLYNFDVDQRTSSYRVLHGVEPGGSEFAPATRSAALHVMVGKGNIVYNNIFSNNGNFIDRNICDNSSTSPMIFGEAAPTASNATWGFTATGPYEGTGQYRFSKTVAAGTKAYLHLVDNVGAADVHGLIPGTQYEWSGWFKCYSSASGGFQGPRFYQATTAGGATSATAVTIATASWQWVAVTATIYVNATTAYFGFWASASLGSTTYFDVDNVRLFPPGTTNVHNQNYYNGGTDTYDGL